MINGLFKFGDNWADTLAVSPPPFFDPDLGYQFATDSLGVGVFEMDFAGDLALLPGSYQVTLSVQGNPLGQLLRFEVEYDLGGLQHLFFPMGQDLGVYTIDFTVPTGVTALTVRVWDFTTGANLAPKYLGCIIQPVMAGLNQPVLVNGGSSDYDRDLCYNSPVDYNNGRFIDPRTKTLSQLRTAVVRRLGYAANTVRPDMASLVDDFINDANTQLYERYPVMRLVRWYTWQTQPGQRFYDVPIDCTKYLDFRHVQSAWLQDDDAWFPLVAGINPILYNQVYQSLPQYYELRDVIELWPVPDKPTYLLHLKGQIGPLPMTEDEDTSTVDSHAVFLMALANAKAHYGQPDATRYDRQLEIYIGRLTAGSHYTKRYIPQQPIPVGLPLPIRQVPGG